MTGIVEQFDEYVGLGVVVSDDGGAFPFHCTQIADGSRTIAAGTAVSFVVTPRHKGDEAYAVTPA